MSDSTQQRGLFGQWYWTWLVSALFIVVMGLYFFHRPLWLYYTYRGISLSHEMNYAVWWSGILLFLAGLVFCRVGMLAHAAGRVAWVWYVLGLAMLALCFDEVGSLHELVSTLGGWLGLLPFAAVFGIAFGLALIELVRRWEMRIVALLIVISLTIFVAVAGLEALEHRGGRVHHLWRKLRLVGEEGSELIAMGLLLTAGLMAMARMGDGDRSFLNATAAVPVLLDHALWIFLIFALHCAVTIAFIVPNYTWFLEGNPSVLFPMLLFFCLGILARMHARDGVNPGFWTFMAILFFVTSALQMYNLNTFFNQLLNVEINLLTRQPLSWLVTLVPLLFLYWFGRREGVLAWRDLVHPLIALLLIVILLYPDLALRYRVEYHYYLFSGTVAWCCLRLLQRL